MCGWHSGSLLLLPFVGPHSFVFWSIYHKKWWHFCSPQVFARLLQNQTNAPRKDPVKQHSPQCGPLCIIILAHLPHWILARVFLIIHSLVIMLHINRRQTKFIRTRWQLAAGLTQIWFPVYDPVYPAHHDNVFCQTGINTINQNTQMIITIDHCPLRSPWLLSSPRQTSNSTLSAPLCPFKYVATSTWSDNAKITSFTTNRITLTLLKETACWDWYVKGLLNVLWMDIEYEQGDKVFMMDIFSLILLIDILTLASKHWNITISPRAWGTSWLDGAPLVTNCFILNKWRSNGHVCCVVRLTSVLWGPD